MAQFRCSQIMIYRYIAILRDDEADVLRVARPLARPRRPFGHSGTITRGLGFSLGLLGAKLSGEFFYTFRTALSGRTVTSS